jgi:hypothetical protein
MQPASSRTDGRSNLALSPCRWLLCLGLALCAAFGTNASSAKDKPSRHRPPDLRIVEVTISTEPYSPESGPLELSVEVELPGDLDGATVLEVSSLISSPSKRSMRFLRDRRPVHLHDQADQVRTVDGKPRALVTLRWDGTDQAKRRVDRGRYNYEIRAKLLAVGEEGPRTQMVSWPKRGTLQVE